MAVRTSGVLAANRLLKWLRDCQQAYDVAKAIELSKAKLNKQLVAEYTEQFPKEYAGSLRLLRYLHQTDFFSVSDSVEQDVIDYVAKNKFRTPEEKGYSVSTSTNGLPQAFAHRSDGRLAFLLFDALDQRTKDSAVNEESTGELALAKDAPEAIRNAAQWLHQKHVDPTSVVIFWNRGNGNMADYALDGDKAWVPNWKDPTKIDGFAGRYAGYPVWECSVRHRPMIAAVDLRASKPLLVRPSVSEDDTWCEVLEISVKLDKSLKRRIRKNHRSSSVRPMVGHYCRRRLRFFWDINVKSLKEHASLFCFETDKKEAEEI